MGYGGSPSLSVLVQSLKIDWSLLEPFADGAWCRACRFYRFVGSIGLDVGHGASTVVIRDSRVVEARELYQLKKVQLKEEVISENSRRQLYAFGRIFRNVTCRCGFMCMHRRPCWNVNLI